MRGIELAAAAILPLAMLVAGVAPHWAHIGGQLWWFGLVFGVVLGALSVLDVSHSGLRGSLVGFGVLATVQLAAGLFGVGGNLQVFFPGLGLGILSAFVIAALAGGDREHA